MQYKGIICFSAIDWNFLRQRVHYLMLGLAGKGFKTLFIENTGVRTPKFSDFPRLLSRLKSAAVKTTGNELPTGLIIFSPLSLPFPYSQFAVNFNRKYIYSRIKKFLNDYNLKPFEVVFWTYLATPLILELMQAQPWGIKVYDVVSDPKIVEPRLESFEKLLVSRVDFTLFASATLYNDYSGYTRNPILFKDGFNLDILRKEDIYSEALKLPRPRLFYIGGINKKINVDVLSALAGYFNKGSIILVGPRSSDVILPLNKNIYTFPQCGNYDDLAGFLKVADVGLIPYYSDNYTGAMHPAKLNEYLVSGLPVVGTSTPELEILSELWGKGIFYLGDTPDEIVAVAEKALAEDDENLREKRLDLAKNNTWDRRIQVLVDIFFKKP